MDNNEEIQQITIINEDGNEKLYNILFTFNSEDYNRSYVFVYDAEEPNDQEITIQAYAFEDKDGDGEVDDNELIPIEDDDEWSMAEEVLNTFFAEEENKSDN